MQTSGSDSGQQPLVSIITPSYNAMPYIVENIESVLAQDYPNLEHIIYDGGSTDGTIEVFQKYPHLTWVSEPDRGQSDALNKGFAQAEGDVIGWLNADDSYWRGAISFAVQYLQNHPDVDLIHSDVQLIDGDSKPVNTVKAQPVDTEILLTVNHIKQPTIFMRRRVIEQLIGLDESLHYIMDWEFWLRASVAFNMQYIPDHIFANFRFAPGTKSFEAVPEFSNEWIRVLERIIDNPAFDSVPNSTKHKAIRLAKSQNHIAHTVKAIGQRDRQAVFGHMMKAIALNWKLIFNRGTYLFVYKGLMGKDVDRLRKFRKSISWTAYVMKQITRINGLNHNIGHFLR